MLRSNVRDNIVEYRSCTKHCLMLRLKSFKGIDMAVWETFSALGLGIMVRHVSKCDTKNSFHYYAISSKFSVAEEVPKTRPSPRPI